MKKIRLHIKTILALAAAMILPAFIFAEKETEEKSPIQLNINIDGKKESVWGVSPTMKFNSSSDKPADFNLDGGLYIKENKETIFFGINLDPDPADGIRVSELQILIGKEGIPGASYDPYNFNSERITYQGFSPAVSIPIQWDSNQDGKIISGGYCSWNDANQKWDYSTLTAKNIKIAANDGTGVGTGEKVSKIAKKDTFVEFSIPKSLLAWTTPSEKIQYAVILKSDAYSPGACACIPEDAEFVSEFGTSKTSALKNAATYELVSNPLPAKTYTRKDYITDIVDVFSQWCIPLLIFSICVFAFFKKVKVYEVFIDGAKEGFNTAIMIIPYLVAILFAIGMFRAGGCEKIIIDIINPLLIKIGVPSSILPLILIRPLSGGGARGVMLDIFAKYGPDSLDGLIASVIQGSTETTFYVIAVYLGSIGVKRTRYAVPACLFGDIIGFVASIIICWLMFGANGLMK